MPISRNKKTLEKGYRNLRKHRYSQKGHFYFITTCCYDKRPLFAISDVVQIVFDAIDWLEKGKCIDCHFVILMPDHLHLVFQLTGDKKLSEVMKSLKGFTGRKIKQYLSSNNPV